MKTSSAEQVEWILGDSAARAVFAETSTHEEIISSVRCRLPGVEHLWMIDGLDTLASGGGQISKEQLDQRRSGRKAADLTTVIYTSGTTGRPKVPDSSGWLRTGDIGALDDAGFLRVTGRHKDLIVTAGGTNVAPAVLEGRVRAHPLVSQCMVIGDGRPYIACLVTLDPEALESWQRQRRRPAGATPHDLAEDPELIAEIQLAVDEANKAVSRAESIRRFRILGTDFTEASGQLTPSAKVRRNMVARDFATDIEALCNRRG